MSLCHHYATKPRQTKVKKFTHLLYNCVSWVRLIVDSWPLYAESQHQCTKLNATVTKLRQSKANWPTGQCYLQFQLPALHQPKLQDHEHGAILSYGVPVYSQPTAWWQKICDNNLPKIALNSAMAWLEPAIYNRNSNAGSNHYATKPRQTKVKKFTHLLYNCVSWVRLIVDSWPLYAESQHQLSIITHEHELPESK